MAALQNRLDETLSRADEVLRQRVRREELAEAEEARAREAARRQRQRDNAESRRVIAETYADAYASFGVEVPAPADDEGRRRTAVACTTAWRASCQPAMTLRTFAPTISAVRPSCLIISSNCCWTRRRPKTSSRAMTICPATVR
jgi:hypothetical protein